MPRKSPTLAAIVIVIAVYQDCFGKFHAERFDFHDFPLHLYYLDFDFSRLSSVEFPGRETVDASSVWALL